MREISSIHVDDNIVNTWDNLSNVKRDKRKKLFITCLDNIRMYMYNICVCIYIHCRSYIFQVISYMKLYKKVDFK